MMNKTGNTFGLSVLVLGGALGMTALAQSSAPAADPAAATTKSKANADDSSTYATGKPLEMQSKEGFWGHMNPLARKRWVHRQVDPIKDRTNELDQLQAKNANDIRDVDSRATAGINKAMNAANTADQHAVDAGNRANAAQNTATTASTRTDALHSTVSNLDQFQTVSATEVPFVSGRTTLGPKAKADLDDVARRRAARRATSLKCRALAGLACRPHRRWLTLSSAILSRTSGSGVPDLSYGAWKKYGNGG